MPDPFLTLAVLFGQAPSLDVAGLLLRVVVALGITAGAMLMITGILKRYGLGQGSSSMRKDRKRGKVKRAERKATGPGKGSVQPGRAARGVTQGHPKDGDRQGGGFLARFVGRKGDTPTLPLDLSEMAEEDGGIVIEEMVPVTDSATLVTVWAHGHRLLLGVTDQQINLIQSLSSPADEGVEDPAHRDEHPLGEDGTYWEEEAEPLGLEAGFTGERVPLDLELVRATQLRQRWAD